MSSEEEVIELEPCEAAEDSVDEVKPIHRWIRFLLLILTVPWLIVFFVAIFLLNPYENGEPLKMGTHQQLGLPECNFKAMAGLPCPSCGMTTSFTLLIRADVWNSMQANFAGTVLASFGLLFIPWAFASAFFGRFVFIRSLELVVFRLAIVFLIVLFGRWAIVLVWELFLRW
jgi:Protein of unknown function (DUF2752)